MGSDKITSMKKLKLENEIIRRDIQRIKLKIAEKVMEKYL
jgi:hypothetical protein